MRRYLHVLLVVALIGFLAIGCSEDSKKTAEELLIESTDLFKIGQKEDSLKKARKALKKAEKEYGEQSPQLVKYLQTAAFGYQSDKQFAEAEKHYNRALDIIIKTEGKESFEVAKVMNNLAGLYFFQNQFDKAITYYEQSMAIGKQYFAPDAPEMITIQKNIDMIEKLKSGQAGGMAADTGVAPPRPDYVPEEIKKAALETMAKQKIFVTDLRPMEPVNIDDTGVVFPYRGTKKLDESLNEGMDAVLLFAALRNPEKQNAYSFRNCRLVSYESYMAELSKKDDTSLKQALTSIFPDVFTK